MKTQVDCEKDHHARFLFDPVCPWAWRASLWMRAVARVRSVEIEWGLLSLEYLNRDSEDNPFHGLHLKSRLPLRLLALARDSGGNGGIDKLYLALGDLYAQGRELDDDAVLAEALARTCLSPLLLQEAHRRNDLDDALQGGYERAWLGGAFGVPTIYIDRSEVPFFGPVIDSVPSDREAGELWDHVLGLSRHPYFFELKRERP